MEWLPDVTRQHLSNTLTVYALFDFHRTLDSCPLWTFLLSFSTTSACWLLEKAAIGYYGF